NLVRICITESARRFSLNRNSCFFGTAFQLLVPFFYNNRAVAENRSLSKFHSSHLSRIHADTVACVSHIYDNSKCRTDSCATPVSSGLCRLFPCRGSRINTGLAASFPGKHQSLHNHLNNNSE